MAEASGQERCKVGIRAKCMSVMLRVGKLYKFTVRSQEQCSLAKAASAHSPRLSPEFFWMLEWVQPCVEEVGSARELATTPPWELALASDWQEQMDKYLSWNDAKITVLEGSPAGLHPRCSYMSPAQ